MLGNYLIHRKSHPDIHREYHNLLHFLHKDYQLYKKVHLQQSGHNSNQIHNEIQGILGNCSIHRKDHPGIHHEYRNLLHLLHKDYQLYKNFHLQQSGQNSNQIHNEIQGIQGNCSIHRKDQPGIHHEYRNLLDLIHMELQMCKNHFHLHILC